MRRYFASRASTASGNVARLVQRCAANSFTYLLANIVSATPLAAGMLLLSRYKLLYEDWRGYRVAFFALVWVANQYLNRLCLDLRLEQVEIKADEKNVDRINAAEGKIDRRKAA